ncbi:uncharacterized protein NAREPO1_02260 [endosymbiont of Euscepes postfasciatus]|uniref:hypothetical protein n=1 Tax=endosymbiont of Euscepes postfasciatus TaxID=650377 RepID=UPI000DC6E3CC|nr:hypothetical protein [endosymbiont of Euscepes postfasciatus]BBA84734.1 uncharacterized protein NAREPO1_02260 [endosymbiont of Euscepes postfasciatus]
MNKNILYIYTSKLKCNILLLYNNNIIKSKKYSYKNHLNVILKELNNIIKNNNININNINLISSINDPINISSIKFGLSISQGLSIGLNIPLIKLSLYEIILYKIKKKNIKNNNNNNILIIINITNNTFLLVICKLKLNKYKIKKYIYNLKEIINYIIYNQNINWIINTNNFKNKIKNFIYNKKIKFINYGYTNNEIIFDIINEKINIL